MADSHGTCPPPIENHHVKMVRSPRDEWNCRRGKARRIEKRGVAMQGYEEAAFAKTQENLLSCLIV
jgi:hypothetical protein